MRTKKMLAMLLAVMMVVMMIPIGAAAAVPTDAPEINVELKSTGTFGELTQELTLTNTYKTQWGKETAKFDSISEYKAFSKAVNATNRAPVMLDPDSSDDWANNIAVYGQLKDAAATSTVNKGGTAYVTVKVTAPASANGVVPTQVIIKYDTDSFEVPTDKTDVVPNLLATDTAVTRPVNVLLDDGTGKTYGGTYEAPSAFTNYAGKEGDTNVGAGKSVAVLKFGYPSGNATLINATGTTWDYVIPFKVKDTATLGEHTFEAISNFKIDANYASTQMWVPKNAYDGTTKLNTSTASTGYDGDSTSANAAGDKLKYGSTVVKIVNPSKEPDGTYTTENIVNDKNKPYEGNTGTDYLKFPSNESVFKVGDTVLIYKQGEDENTYGDLLGRTTITDNTLVTLGEDGNETPVTKADGATVKNLALKLIDDEVVSEGETTLPSADKSYLKGEKKICIARLDNTGGFDVSDAAKAKRIDINPESIVYFNQDLEGVTDGLPGSKSNPLKIKLGDTIGDVVNTLMEQGSVPTINPSAPVESGIRTQNTVKTSLESSWMQSTLYTTLPQDGADSGSASSTGKFIRHGTFAIRNPFQEITVDGVEYKQPTSTSDTTNFDIPTSTSADKASTKTGYGTVIWVNVLPNPADYYLAATTDGANLTVLGETKKAMQSGDQIALYATEDPVTSPTISGAKNIDAGVDLDSSKSSTSFTLDPASFKPAKGETYWLSYWNDVSGGRYQASDRIQIRVADGTKAIVLQDVTAETSFYRDETINTVLDTIKSVDFTVVGPVTGGEIESTVYSLSSSMLKDRINTTGDNFADPQNVTFAELTDSGEKEILAEDLATTINKTKDETDLDREFLISIVIPETEAYQKLLKNDGQTEAAAAVREYSNAAIGDSPARAVKVTARVQKSIKFSPDTVFTLGDNKPLGIGKDTMTITGDEYGILAEMLDTEPGKVQLNLMTKDTPTQVSGKAFGLSDGIRDISYTKNPDNTYDYVVKFNQTARDKGTKLDLVTIYTNGANVTVGEVEVVNQEEYALFSVDQPTPETIQIPVGDLNGGDETKTTFTDDEIYTHINGMSGVTGPKITYGYYIYDDEGAIYIDPSAKYSKQLMDNVYAAANWEKVPDESFAVDKTIEIKLQASTNWDNLTAADEKNGGGAMLPIRLSTGWTAPEIKQKVEIVAGTYGEGDETPKPADVIGSSDTVAENNPYPENDVLKVASARNADDTDAADDYKHLIVDIYTTNAPADGKDHLSGHIATAKLGEVAAGSTFVNAVFDDDIDAQTVLNSMGGSLWYTVRRKSDSTVEPPVTGLAPSTAIEKTYNVEDYILWTGETTISPDKLSVKTSKVSSAAEVENRLPKTAHAIAVHLTKDEHGHFVIRGLEGFKEQVNVYPTVEKWLNSAGNEVTDATFDFTKDGTYTLKARYSDASVTEPGEETAANYPANEVKVTNSKGNADTAKITNQIDGVTIPTGYNITNNVTVTFDETTAEISVKPDPLDVTVKQNPPAGETKDNTDYTITIDVSGATNIDLNETPDGSKPSYKDLAIIIKYPGPDGKDHYYVLPQGNIKKETVTGEGGETTEKFVATIDKAGTTGLDTTAAIADAKTDPSLADVTFDTEFKGLYPDANGNVEIYFKETDKVKSERTDAAYSKASDGLVIEKDTKITTLNLSVGMILSADDLLSLVSSITEATPVLAGGAAAGPVKLVTEDITVPGESEGETTTKTVVKWVLKKTTITSTGDSEVITFGAEVPKTIPAAGEEPKKDGYKEAMAAVPADGEGYALVAEFDEDELKKQNITNSSDPKKVAFVKIMLYNDNDVDPEKRNPLQLTEGNSDLWKNGADTESLAYKELVRRGDIADGATGDDVTNAIAKYRTDTIFFFNFETYDTDVKPYTDLASNIASVKLPGAADPLTGTDLTAWLADATVKSVEQLNASDKTPIVIQRYDADGNATDTVDYIEPHHSDNKANYFVFAESVTRFLEDYVIRYTVEKDGETYMVERKVKLIYRSGDPNGDKEKNDDDVEAEQRAIAGDAVFIPAEGASAEVIAAYADAGLYVVDPNGDGEKNDDDIETLQYMIAGEPYPAKRW